jgi:hypothetical protein
LFATEGFKPQTDVTIQLKVALHHLNHNGYFAAYWSRASCKRLLDPQQISLSGVSPLFKILVLDFLGGQTQRRKRLLSKVSSTGSVLGILPGQWMGP